MRKLLSWLDNHILKIGICFLLFFIPLYPKLPLFSVENTWVYIRLEDIFVAFLIFIFFLQLVRKKATFKSPLSLPIFVYWLIGGISLVFSILVLGPHLANFFPKVAILHFLRRIEYMMLFFIAFSAIKTRKDVYHCLAFFILGVFGVVIYGFGQKILGFPAFLTMNEEFAKGIPLYLPSGARATSTFAGHYDLSAYLILALSLFLSLIFGLKAKWEKLGLLFIGLGGYFLLLFTASRISFAAYLIIISLVLFLQRRKWLIIPVVLISLFLMKESPGALDRFSKTLRVEQVVYDVNTGKAIGTLEELMADLNSVKKEQEDLPLGSGFLEVPLLEKESSSSALKEIRIITLKTASQSAQLATISGEFLVKRAIVYDISFTTRFQGGWPRAIKAFKRNIFLGSGFSSIDLATDNDYLRLLGETGILGFSSFLLILFTALIIARQSLRKIDNSFARSVVIGIVGGIIGLSLNALLIDVFEASKVAYIFWIMIGIMTALYVSLVKKKESLIKEGLNFLNKPITPIILLALITISVFYSALANYFTADDFTWLKWAATTNLADIPGFFINAAGFFYRPLIKSVFYFLYQFLGLKSFGYHLISFGLHFLTSMMVYLTAFFLAGESSSEAKSRTVPTLRRDWRRDNFFIAFLAGFFFLLHPIHGETIFWVSGYSGLFSAFFYSLSVYLFLRQEKAKNWFKRMCCLGGPFFFILSLASYELAVTLPLILSFYLIVFKGIKRFKESFKKILPYFGILAFYLFLRNVIARAHPLSGDYNYNLGNSVFNFFGNLIGYSGELILGFRFIPFYDFLRESLRGQKLIAALFLIVVLSLIYYFKKELKKIKINKLIIFSFGWILIALLPVIGLGNIAERYLYIPSIGFVILLAIIIIKLYEKKSLIFKLIAIMMVITMTRFYYLELRKSESTWEIAGEASNKILRALSTNYKQFPEKSTLYFVNLPLRVERAWVFPVGLK
ncbi:hypothetical protein ISS85_05575, partial [Candidatus Microgenomates bacterium]|nr:hypothetical protein [Candidatus Microgenomates bacterium]